MNKIDSQISEKFAKGLQVFSGKSTYGKVIRGKFEMASSTVTEDGLYYIDQWFPGNLGGGQEILEVAGEKYTRVYAGGTVEDAILTPLGITKDIEVMGQLKKFLLAAGGKTRFDMPYAKIDGEWKYEYAPKEFDDITGMITGREKIIYKQTPVFVHFFIISRVTFPI